MILLVPKNLAELGGVVPGYLPKGVEGLDGPFSCGSKASTDPFLAGCSEAGVGSGLQYRIVTGTGT